MKPRLACLCLLLPGALHAQQMVRMTFDPGRVAVHQAVRISVEFDQTDKMVACGLRVVFGDGEVRDLRVEASPVAFEKTYENPGTYSVHLEGKLLFRGLKTVIPCMGTLTSEPLTVFDPADKYRESEAASQARELQLKKDQLQREIDGLTREREHERERIRIEQERIEKSRTRREKAVQEKKIAPPASAPAAKPQRPAPKDKVPVF